MDPHYILIENFMSHRRTEIDCTKFDSVLIIGQDKSNPRESNGVGKSVIYHAIKYALFGTYPTSVVDRVVRDGSEGCRVIFDFALGSKVFRIERSRRKSKSYLNLTEMVDDSFLNKKTQKTTTETHEEILRLIKVNDNAFSNSVLFSQNDLKGLASAKSPEERRIILKDALGLSYYKKLEDMAKKAAAELMKEIDITDGVAKALGDPKKDIDNYNKSLSDVNRVVELKEKEQESIRILLNTKRSELAQLQRLATSDVISAYEKLNDIKENEKKVLSDIQNTKNDIQTNEAKILSLSFSLKNLEESVSSMKKECDSLRVKDIGILSKVENDLNDVNGKEIDSKTQIRSMEKQAAEIRKPIPKGTECPTCRQEITDEYKSNYQSSINIKLISLENQLADNRKKLKKILSKKNRLQNKLDDIISTTSKISLLNGKISNKETEVKHNTDYINRLKRLNNQRNDELILSNKRLESLSGLKKSITSIIDSSSIDNITSKIKSVKSDIDNFENSLSDISHQISEASQNIGIHKANIEVRTKDLAKLNDENKKISKLRSDYKIHKKVQRGFSSSGIPTLIINTILDDLQVEANRFLTNLKPGLELQFIEGLGLYFRVHGAKREYEQLSGGQKMLFAFALKIGLSVVIQRRLGIDIKLLLLDEVDQSLDDACKDTYVDVIKKLQDTFKVLVITHDNRLKDKFINAIVVSGDPINGATAELVSW